MDERTVSPNPTSVAANKDSLTCAEVIKDTRRSFIDTLNSRLLFWHLKCIGIPEISD